MRPMCFTLFQGGYVEWTFLHAEFNRGTGWGLQVTERFPLIIMGTTTNVEICSGVHMAVGWSMTELCGNGC